MPHPAPSSAIAANYDAVAYDAIAHPVTHPDHVAAVVTMFGHDAPPVSSARVLEVGCNDGANLLPMAARLPDAAFTGCDIAPVAIGAAREAATALALRNATIVQADLATLEGGPYDYIIAHGIYSWVEPPVRDALLALAGRTLSRNGILFVSYNTYPGGHVRRATWETLRWHTRDIGSRPLRIKAARELAQLLGAQGATPEAGDTAVRMEFQRIAGESESALFHDTLADINEPVWFHAFVGHANEHGLTYVAEALPSMMAGGGLAPATRQFLASRDRIEREQYLDFARVRRFRQSLLCRSEAAVEFAPDAARLAGLAASASLQLQRAAAEARLPSVPGPDGAVLRAVLDALLACAPASIPAPELIARLQPGAASPGARPVETIVLDAWIAGFVQLHACPPDVAIAPSSRPRASQFARWQAAHRDAVTNLRHETVRLPNAFAKTLLQACDGTSDRDALARATGTDTRSREQLDDTLALFARYALLERD